jgi:Na+-translocating ferredoxin:NAD+ oxidoreductase RNF subunit RnfB
MMSEIVLSLLVLGVVGFGFSLLLAFLSKRLRVEEDARIKKVMDILPGINCGACGFSGCRAFAEAVVSKGDIFSGCLPGGDEINKKILNILGVDSSNFISQNKVVVCHCGAEGKEKKKSSFYSGPLTCRAAHIISGVIDCVYGCLALGDCVRVCPTKAIVLKEERIYVDINKCIGCGNCVRVCPRSLFEFVVLEKEIYYVACNNTEKGMNVKKVCSRGCISCGICTRVKDSPFYIKNNLSYIDYSKAKKREPQEEAMNKCPTRCILRVCLKRLLK